MPRKHLIASGINKKQQNQAKLWMKLAKEIKAAVKVGGTNMEANPRLKAAVNRALQHNLSRDSINRNINGANKDNSQLKEIFYEAYGPNGLAILIKVLTDNEQRSISAIRGYLSKLNGQLAKPNSVQILFEELGEFIIDKTQYSEDMLFQYLLKYEIIKFNEEEDSFIIYCKPNIFYLIKETFDQNNIEMFSSEVKYVANESINLDKGYEEKYEKFISSCENDDDIQWVVTNCENF